MLVIKHRMGVTLALRSQAVAILSVGQEALEIVEAQRKNPECPQYNGDSGEGEAMRSDTGERVLRTMTLPLFLALENQVLQILSLNPVQLSQLLRRYQALQTKAVGLLKLTMKASTLAFQWTIYKATSTLALKRG